MTTAPDPDAHPGDDGGDPDDGGNPDDDGDPDDTDRNHGAVRRAYDHWARYYDWNPALALVRPVRRRAVAAMGLVPGDTAVDMGTGTGANLPHLREAVGPTGSVIGIDLSPEMLTRARARIEREGWDNVTVLKGDVVDPPLERPVDGITSGFLIVMYDHPERLIDAWTEYVADGGAIANVYAGPSDRWYSAVPDALLAAYLRAFEDGWTSPDHAGSPLSTVASRGERARAALAARADASHHENRVFGLAHLDVGTFEST